MFDTTTNVAATVLSLVFRQKAKREGDATRIAEIRYEVPLDVDLAKDVLPEMGSDLFTARGKPKADLREASFHIPAKTYLFTVRQTAAGRAQKISGTTVRAVSAYKTEGKADGEWLLGFTVSFIMLSPEEMLPFLTRLFGSMYLTFEEQEPAIDFEPADDEPAGGEAKVNKRGEVEKVGPKKVH